MFGYSAELNAHRRGHWSISAYVETLISTGAEGQLAGVKTCHGGLSSFDFATFTSLAEFLD